MFLNLVLSEVSLYIQIMCLWQEYHRSDFWSSLHPIRWYTISVCPVTDDTQLDP